MTTPKPRPDDGLVEQIARIIDPSAWRVMDSYLAATQRKYAGQNVGWPTDQFQDKASMRKAHTILAALRPPEQVATPDAVRAAEEMRAVLATLVERSDAVRALAEEQASKMPSKISWHPDGKLTSLDERGEHLPTPAVQR